MISNSKKNPGSPNWAGLECNVYGKVIHPKYYKHLKKGAHQAIWADKKWAGFWQVSLYSKVPNKRGVRITV